MYMYVAINYNIKSPHQDHTATPPKKIKIKIPTTTLGHKANKREVVVVGGKIILSSSNGSNSNHSNSNDGK